jgi:hypothetical protein
MKIRPKDLPGYKPLTSTITCIEEYREAIVDALKAKGHFAYPTSLINRNPKGCRINTSATVTEALKIIKDADLYDATLTLPRQLKTGGR